MNFRAGFLKTLGGGHTRPERCGWKYLVDIFQHWIVEQRETGDGGEMRRVDDTSKRDQLSKEGV